MSTLIWSEIGSIEELLNKENGYIILFKHSPRCIISRIVFSKFKRDYISNNNILKLIYIDVLKMKKISNQIAQYFSINHESPQVILLKNNKVIYHSSHSSVSFNTIKNYIL
jgi:bacillithiol system protein YtxJ